MIFNLNLIDRRKNEVDWWYVANKLFTNSHIIDELVNYDYEKMDERVINLL